jgi:hypothetical protein
MFRWTRIATFAAVAAALAMATGVAGATSKPGGVPAAGSHMGSAGKISSTAARRAALLKAANLRTRAGAARYLRSIGLNARHFVIQRGIRNYAGAKCPGAGWSCTSTAHPVVQITSAGGFNTFQCATASCAVVQVAAPAAKPANSASCIKTTGLNQSCSISQTGGGTAVVYENAGKLTGLTQTASSAASITQRATGTNTNTACVTQAVNIDGSTNLSGKKGASVNVGLEAHQSITISQSSDANGSNTAVNGATASGTCDTNPSSPTYVLNQAQTLSSTATGTGSITQNENAANNGANMTLDIKQNQNAGTGPFGPNAATFNQTNSLTAIANGPGTASQPVSQTQSSVNGGILAAVNQSGPGVSTASATQTETQCADAATSGLTSCSTTEHANPGLASLAQTQFGPVRKAPGDSSQTGNSNDSFTVTQNSRQDSDSGSTQTNVVSAGFSTTGSGTVNQSTNENGTTTTNTQSGQNVNSSINCTSGSSCTGTPPPTPTITDHPSDPSNSSSASFSFTDADPTVAFECQIDSSGYSGCSSAWIYDNLADGAHTFSVKAKSGTGQVSDPATFTWTIAGGNANADLVQQLNPTSDPSGGDCAFGYASGTGFNGIPQEVNDTAGLTAFDGQAIQLRFSFTTRDANFNAFEGWYIKNIQVTGTQSGSPVTVFSDAVADGDTSFTASSDFGVTPGWHITDRFGGPAWWYGNEATGTYQSPNPIDGCTDSSANAGTITSPVFTLATNSQLSFDTLWQIESVNPSTFDLMDVQVIPVTSGPPIG